MTFIQTVFLSAAISGPIAIFIGVVRVGSCFYRSCKAKNVKFAILSGLGIVILLVLFAAIIVVWFAYGVAHTGKDTTTDLVVLASTVTPAYLGTIGMWWLSVFIEKRLRPDAI